MKIFSFFRTPAYWNDHSLSTSHKLGEAVGDVVDNEKEFTISVDVSQFEPSELKVDIIEDELVITGKHDEKTDQHGKVERYFKRKYRLPPSVRPEQVVSELTKEGHLIVKYDKKPETKPKAIHVTIQPKSS